MTKMHGVNSVKLRLLLQFKETTAVYTDSYEHTNTVCTLSVVVNVKADGDVSSNHLKMGYFIVQKYVLHISPYYDVGGHVLIPG
jgi:hypothetical protein